ncbi:MAG: hypothetical protein GTO45_25945 [Candidatus Aminicenantes bacterium]|nr:hypothetical protein [Candidatus Aminicenantes bacterium]NIM82180.1 hypothetical protein [Candidatus Aminicenantes bacterium]NIN21582.1 hypothetical protein [Candidatus Aminicenantes bacterium]NIN45391.1 hypothetical protein [Candidatus Aminicenantes bacterium]NIN88212.1 hypothetical protein [Candidatus Aminicenantes bacterium]
MKRKIFVLVFLALFSVTFLGEKSEKQEFFEDFSVDKGLWQEYDPTNKIELDYTYDHRLEFNHWRRYQAGYVAREYPVQDFVLEYDINITDDGGNANVIGPGFSDTPGTMDTIQNGVYTVYYAGFGGPQIDIATFVNGSVEWSWGGWGEIPNRIWINTNTTYYVRFEKNGDTLKLSIFSDPDRTTHISGSPKTVTTNLINTTFNNFHAVNGYLADPQDNWEWTTGWIDNIYVKGQITPTNTQEIFEDFSVCNSDWVEYDPKNKIEINCTNNHRLEFNHWIRYEPGYVYRPFSTTDFVLEYDINISNHGGNGNIVGPGFSDTPGTMSEIQNGIFGVFYAGWPGGGGVPHLALRIYENKKQILEWTQFLDFLISMNKTYYVRLEKIENEVTISIFSDAARTSHINGSPKTFTTNLTNTAFNYFYAINGYHTSPQDNWEWTSGWIDNIHVLGTWTNQPPVVDAGLDQTVEQETHEGTEVTQIGHVSDANGDALTYQWKQGDTELASGTIPAPNEPPTDAEVTLTHIFPPGEHTVTLTVSDGEISSSNDVLIIVEDTIPPNSSISFDPVPNNVGWNNTDVKVTITAADTNSSVKEIHYTLSTGFSDVVIGDTAEFTLEEPVKYTIEYYAVDNGDNVEYPPKQAAVKIDKMTPQTGYTIVGTPTANPNEYKDTAEVTLTATDDLSQVKEVKYSINGNWNTVTGNEAKFTLGEPGTYTINYYAVDYADNVESTQQLTVKIVDTIPPVSMLTTNPAAPGGFDGWFKSAVQVTITAEDNGSGVKEIYYKKDSDIVFTIVQGNHAVFYPGDGTYTIEYYAVDKAGNEESPHKTYSFKVDTADPETAAAIHGNGSGNTYINHAAILLKASDATSGVKEIHYIINGSETVVSNANATINLNQVGTYTIQYWAIDNSGNQETHHSLQIEIISPQAGVVVIKNIIANLPDTSFAKNAQNRRNALLNKLDQVMAAIDSGQYKDAINKLVNDISKKTDGCITFGATDKNDWIVDCQAQSQLNTWINILVAGLTEMMNG